MVELRINRVRINHSRPVSQWGHRASTLTSLHKWSWVNSLLQIWNIILSNTLLKLYSFIYEMWKVASINIADKSDDTLFFLFVQFLGKIGQSPIYLGLILSHKNPLTRNCCFYVFCSLQKKINNCLVSLLIKFGLTASSAEKFHKFHRKSVRDERSWLVYIFDFFGQLNDWMMRKSLHVICMI